MPASIQTRVAAIKMNILPYIHFISMMIPLPVPIDYWKKIGKLRKYIWNGKHHRIRLTTVVAIIL